MPEWIMERPRAWALIWVGAGFIVIGFVVKQPLLLMTGILMLAIGWWDENRG